MYPLFLFLPLQTADWDAVPSEGEVGPVGQEKSEVPENPEVPPELPSGARSVLPPRGADTLLSFYLPKFM